MYDSIVGRHSRIKVSNSRSPPIGKMTSSSLHPRGPTWEASDPFKTLLTKEGEAVSHEAGWGRRETPSCRKNLGHLSYLLIPLHTVLPREALRGSFPGIFISFYLFIYFILFVVFLPFLGLLPQHMEVPRLGVKSEL